MKRMQRSLSVLVLTAAAFVMTAAFFSPPASAQEYVSTRKAVWIWEPVHMRTTVAAASQPLWTLPVNHASFLDSLVFRRGVTTATVYDTSIGMSSSSFPFPPGLGTAAIAGIDTIGTPWIAIRVGQDTTSFGFTATSGMDSVRVGVEYSYDGANWYPAAGTPTRRFDTVFFTSGASGTQAVSLIGVEGVPGQDAATVTFGCHQGTIALIEPWNVGRALCWANARLRFLIGGDYTGQFKVEVGHWQD